MPFFPATADDLRTATVGTSVVSSTHHPLGAGVWVRIEGAIVQTRSGAGPWYANITSGKVVHYSDLMHDAFPPILRT